MADLTNTKLIDVAALTLYHEGVKTLISDAQDLTSLHTVGYDTTAHVIKFYKEKTTDVTDSTVAAFQVSLADIYTSIGTLSNLTTTEKTNLVGALNEIAAIVGNDTLTTTAQTLTSAINELDAELGTITADAMGTTATTVSGAIKENVDAIKAVADDLGDVSTIDVEVSSGVKADTAVAAINKLKALVDDTQSAGEITIDTSVTTEGYLKSYTIKQGETEVGKIDIPKDLVCTGGEVVTDPEGQPAGTYIKLTIANQDAPIYIDVKTLVDVYTAQASAAQIQLAISATNEISATIVAGSVTATELATDAVTEGKIAADSITTSKIKDSNVTASKLAENSVGATKAAETGVITSTVLDDVVVEALNSATTAVQADQIKLAQKADIDAIFTPAP